MGYARYMLDKVRCSLIKLETGGNTEEEAKAGKDICWMLDLLGICWIKSDVV